MDNIIKLDRFIPRNYQEKLCKAFESHQFKRFLLVWPRRSGKEICAINLVVREAFRRVGTYYIVYPNFSSGRRILWDAIDIDGRKILRHYIPDEIVESRHEQQMRIRLINGSQIQILGSDNVDNSLVGTNAVGIVYSEFALQDPRAWSLAIPILKASAGWAMFISTPRGKNAFWEMYNIAKTTEDWFCELLTLNDTKHISIEEIERDIATGQISRDLAQQEYFCDFTLGVEGSYYGKYIDEMRRADRVTQVPWDPYLPVHTAWDLGYSDPTTILFVQVHNNQVRIIDTYENTKQGLEHYAKVLKEKPYSYGKHVAPFDIAVHDLSTGLSRWKMMHDLGITFMRYSEKPCSIDDGIEMVRRALPRMWIDEKRCKDFLNAIENYRQEYDNKKRIYKTTPLHDFSSHWSDALRYLCVALPKLQSGASPEDIDNRYNKAIYGGERLSGFFSDDKNGYY